MNTETTAKRTPMALYFDRAALAVEIDNLKKRAELLEVELAKTKKDLEEKHSKMNQLALIAIGRLRKKNG